MSLSKIGQLRLAAERDFETFLRLVAPQQLLGGMHRDLIQFWTREGAKSHQLALLPRDHGKSRMVAFRAAWAITKDPTITILYISATLGLGQKQLTFIKDILTSPIYRHYWPEMVAERDGERKKWSETEIVVDHPKRKATLLKDPTIMAAGLTTNIIGMHFDVCILDDVVVSNNAWTKDGREKTDTQISYLASILGAEGNIWAVGTRYHPEDYYAKAKELTYDLYDDDGNLEGKEHLYEVHERVVEDSGVGVGPFLWPRTTSSDGKSYGFDRNILARKRAQYSNIVDYRAQYYNDPSDTQGAITNRDDIRYYDSSKLKWHKGFLYFEKERLNVVMAIDFAYSLSTRADYTTIAVVGVNADQQYLILDLDRFKTDKVQDYYEHLRDMHLKWDVRKLRAEVTAAQQVIVKDLKDNWFKVNGLLMQVDEYRPTVREGSKEERMMYVLQPKYAEGRIFHFRGGVNDELENELTDGNSKHDDIIDALAAAVDFAKPPSRHNPFARMSENAIKDGTVGGLRGNRSRFGGITKVWTNVSRAE
jgi:phage terminase large subunit-like protein